MTQTKELARIDAVSLDDRSRGELIKLVLVFQLKLALDGLKDLVLSPLIFVALLFDLFKPTREPGEQLGRIFRAGLVFEEWLDLYSPARDPDVAAALGPTPLAGGFDAGLSQVETVVREQLDPDAPGSLAEQLPKKAKEAKQAFDGLVGGRTGADAHRSKDSDSDL